jgi:hypothetical protein
MKAIKLIFIAVIFIIMMFLTAIPYVGDSPSLAGGSIGSIMIMITIRAAISTVLLVAFVLMSYFYFKKKVKAVFLILTFLLWFVSGRMIGILPDGRLSTGWFYMETDRIDLCDHKTDCETVMAQQTKIQKLLFWRIRVKNKTTDQIIFVGPMLWNNALKVFHETFKAGEI